MNLDIVVVGRVQGVGYRPFVRAEAKALGLNGLVRNCGGFVQILVSGERSTLHLFLQVLSSKCPKRAHITGIHIRKSSEDGMIYSNGFYIAKSVEDSFFHPVLPADISICDTCSAEMMDKNDRRYRYPFISCTSCGPRFSILNNLPYDREHITMDQFQMCPACRAEYEGTGERSHAQTISCPDCGPQLLLATPEGDLQKDEALEEAISMLKAGRVLAVKGIGGYQLVCVADDDKAVLAIREFKHRDKKPLAVMLHDLSDIKAICRTSDKEEALLTSPARPIVLLEPVSERFSRHIVGDSRLIGVFLPYTGLHLMLTEACGPLVVTSLNPTDAPIIFRDTDVPRPSHEVPHGILYHNREIVTPLDDSVVRVIGERTQFIRRARGYAPTPMFLKDKTDTVILATGGDLKSALCLMAGEHAYISQYLGDLESYSAQRNYRAEYLRMENLLGLEPEILVKDMHPDYHSGRMVILPSGSKPRQVTIMETKAEDESNRLADYRIDDSIFDESSIPLDAQFPNHQADAGSATEPLTSSDRQEVLDQTSKGSMKTASASASGEISLQTMVSDEISASGAALIVVDDPESESIVKIDSEEQEPAGFSLPKEESVDYTRNEEDVASAVVADGSESIFDRPETKNSEVSGTGKTDLDESSNSGLAESQDGDPGSGAAPMLTRITEVLTVQHHHAHIASVMAEHLLPSCIGVAFDGTGYGTDGNIWGGEFLLVLGSTFTRETHLANVRIVGGDTAIKRPDTTAFCYLAATGEDMRHEDSDILRAALRNKTLTFKTSSMGRLFDAVSNVLEFSDINTFEGESAILLENAAHEAVKCEVAPFALHFAKARDKDEGMPDAAAIVRDIRYAYLVGIDRRALAYAFHEAVAEMTVNECIKIRAKTGENRVALAGGVFANAILTEMITNGLKENAFSVYMNEALPPNDGSISLGQAWIALLRRKGL